MAGNFDAANAAPRCKARGRRTGKPCGRPARYGLTVCDLHGAATKAARAKSDEARASDVVATRMARFVTPIDVDDPECNPITAFEMEHRRTVARIRWLDEEISLLEVEALTFGKTKEEQIEATEYGGTNVTYEAGTNALYAMQERERKHLHELVKTYVAAKLDIRRLELQARQVEALDLAVTGILTKLGHDPAAANVRSIVRKEFLAVGAMPRTA